MSILASSKLQTATLEFFAEFLGTFLILLFGNGCGGAMLLAAIQGFWQAGIVWGLGVLCAILVSAPVSGAHLNPAVTLGMSAAGKHPLWKIPHYIFAQYCGALVGASFVYSFYSPIIAALESRLGIIRGNGGSFLSASMFNCTLNPHITGLHGFYIEWFITTILLIVICVVNDPNAGGKKGYGPCFPPLVIGFTVAILVACFGPLTAGCLNPVRDLGPRTLMAFAGWRQSAFPGESQNPFWPFLCGPILGGITGVLFWEYTGARFFKAVRPINELTAIGSDNNKDQTFA